MKVQCDNPEAVVKEAFWLAWQACGGPLGMGVFQDRPGVTKDQVWKNVGGSEDYAFSNNKPGNVYGDYVFGRMMKVGFKWDADSITISDATPRGDYQAWCHTYPTYSALVEAAVKSLKEPAPA